MRTFEIIIASILLIRILLPLINRLRWVSWVSLATLAATFLHLLFEGYRWQMIPLYLITIGYTAASFRPINCDQKTTRKRYVTVAAGLAALGISLALPILIPVPHTPKPTGPYRVGTTTIQLIDRNRKELYSGLQNEPRSFQVQIWYPAEADSDAKPAPWMDHVEVVGPALAAKLNLPPFFLDHIRYAKAHSVHNAPPATAQSQYPLLLFSHGWEGFKSQNTYQVEELASHGYVVAAPDHTFGAIASVFPDGKIALINPEALPIGRGLSEGDFIAAVQILGDQWAGDLQFILKSLETDQKADLTGLLAEMIDFSNVGVLGHSTGGGAAIQYCATDEHCQAAFGMDPYMDPVATDIQNSGLEQPYLVMFSESWAEEVADNNAVFTRFFGSSEGDKYHFTIEDTMHYDFTDLPAFSPLAPYLGLKGTLDGRQVLTIINTYSLAFFDRYLKGQPGLILDQPSDSFPEMIYRP